MKTRERLPWPASLLISLLALGLIACEMQPAEILDRPRILAIRATPAGFTAGDEVRLEALTFAVDSELVWSACPVLWAPTDPPSCPVAPAIPLGEGAVVTFTAPDGLDNLWVQALAPEALPAARLLKADPAITNPPLLGLRVDGDSEPSATIRVGDEVSLAPRFAVGVDPDTLITSWYVTAGTLEPPRTLGVEPATLTVDEAVHGVSIIAVVRNTDGGVAWTSLDLEVSP